MLLWTAQLLLRSHTSSMSARDPSFWVSEDLQYCSKRGSTTLNSLSYTGRGSRQSCKMMYREEWTEALSPQLGLCEVPPDSRGSRKSKTLLCGYLRLVCLAISSRRSPREGRTEPRRHNGKFVTAFCGTAISQRSSRRIGSMSDGKLGEQGRRTMDTRRKGKEFG